MNLIKKCTRRPTFTLSPISLSFSVCFGSTLFFVCLLERDAMFHLVLFHVSLRFLFVPLS